MKTGAGAFAVASAGRLIGAAAPSNRVRLALVGCRPNGRGGDLMRNAIRLAREGVDIAYVCDVDSRGREQSAEIIKKATGVEPVKAADLRKVLEDKALDGIMSATPDHWHAPSAVMAMRAGKHVYVEKPCAFCPREGEIMLDVWRQTGKVLQVGTQRRSAPLVRQAMEEIAAERLLGTPRWGRCWFLSKRAPIGRGRECAPPEWLDWDLWQGPAPRRAFRSNVVHYKWHWFRHWGTGECGNNSVHFMDLVRGVLGVEWPQRVVAGGGKVWIPEGDDWEWPDMHNYTFEFPGGKVITWEGISCMAAQPYMGMATGAMVYGDKACVLFRPNNTVEMFDLGGQLIREWKGAKPVGEAKDTSNRQNGGPGDSTLYHLRNFVDCIRANTPDKANANAEIGVKSTFLALAANIAHRTGETVRIDPATGRLAKGSAGADLWAREYEKGWEIG